MRDIMHYVSAMPILHCFCDCFIIIFSDFIYTYCIIHDCTPWLTIFGVSNKLDCTWIEIKVNSHAKFQFQIKLWRVCQKHLTCIRNHRQDRWPEAEQQTYNAKKESNHPFWGMSDAGKVFTWKKYTISKQHNHSLLLQRSIDASSSISSSPLGRTGTTHLGRLIISSSLLSSACGKSGSWSSAESPDAISSCSLATFKY